MEHNTTLNLSCNFNGYMVCQMPKNMVEVELKIKMTQGKYTFNKTLVPEQRGTIHGTGQIEEPRFILRKEDK